MTQVTQYLDQKGVAYHVLQHAPAFTAQQVAQAAHIHGVKLAKSVLVEADGILMLVVIPACHHLVLGALEHELGLSHIELATEQQLDKHFFQCQEGAAPPLSGLYGIPVYMAQVLRDQDEIIFNAGRHDELIKMAMQDYLDFEKPLIVATASAPMGMTPPKMSHRVRRFV